jgi:uncharacterized protein
MPANIYPVINSVEQAVSFQNEGQTLYGMLHLPNTSSPHPAVLLLHGLTGDKTGSHRLFVHMARALTARGIAAFRFDMRGSGDSEGEFQDMTLAGETSDAQAALDWLIGHPAIDPARIGSLGLSLGGLVQSLLAGSNAQRLRGLAYWAAAANREVFTSFAQRTAERRGSNTEDLMQQLMQTGYVMLWGYPVGIPFIQDFFQSDAMSGLSNYTGPVIIVHNTGDPTVPVGQADVLAAHFGVRAEVHKLDNDTHSFEPPPNEKEAIDLTLEWFTRVLA